MIEPLVFQFNAKAGGYMVDGDPNKILPLVPPGSQTRGGHRARGGRGGASAPASFSVAFKIGDELRP
jgi:hypothetical protein